MSFYGEDSPTDATESRRKYLQSWRDKLGPYKFEARNDLRATDGARRAAPARDARRAFDTAEARARERARRRARESEETGGPSRGVGSTATARRSERRRTRD